MDNIDFPSLPDAEATRLMAERDGLSPRPYTTSLDAAVGWLERMGLKWEKRIRTFDNVDFVLVYTDVEMSEFANKRGLQWRGIECAITDSCPTPRALCNAGWAAVQAREWKG